jgi:L-ascorbate metabolism protein UlaG (beta-lactamase superfamily)
LSGIYPVHRACNHPSADRGCASSHRYPVRFRSGTSIYFSGDSAYSTLFRNIGDAYDIDVALLPIGLATPSWLFGRTHMDPGRAIQAFIDVKAKTMVPVHYGPFRTTLENPVWPLKEFVRLAGDRGILDRVAILEK